MEVETRLTAFLADKSINRRRGSRADGRCCYGIGGHSAPSRTLQIPARRLMPSNIPGIVKPDIQTPGETESAEHMQVPFSALENWIPDHTNTKLIPPVRTFRATIIK